MPVGLAQDRAPLVPSEADLRVPAALGVPVKKGPLAEKQVVEFLQANGFPHAERRVMGGANDRGDVAGIPGLVIEVKNQAKMTLAEWVDEAERESVSHEDFGVVWHKRRGKGSAGEWYVTMDGWTFLELLKGQTR